MNGQQHGVRALGQSKAGCNACEKAVETKTRQQGDAQCREVE